MPESTNYDPDVSCPACHTPNGRFEPFCRNCGLPIGTTATLNRVPRIQAESFLFRKALAGPPKPIVLIGMWILFLPLIVIGVYAIIQVIQIFSGFAGFIFFWALVGLTYIAFMILYRLTKNYITARRS